MVPLKLLLSISRDGHAAILEDRIRPPDPWGLQVHLFQLKAPWEKPLRKVGLCWALRTHAYPALVIEMHIHHARRASPPLGGAFRSPKFGDAFSSALGCHQGHWGSVTGFRESNRNGMGNISFSIPFRSIPAESRILALPLANNMHLPPCQLQLHHDEHINSNGRRENEDGGFIL